MTFQQRTLVCHFHQLERTIFKLQFPKTPRDARCTRQKPWRQIPSINFIESLQEPVRRALWNLKATPFERVEHAACAKAQAERIRPMNEWISRKQNVVAVRTHVGQNKASKSL